MRNHIIHIVIGAAILLSGTFPLEAALIQQPLPYNNNILAYGEIDSGFDTSDFNNPGWPTVTFVDGGWDNLNWLSDGIDNTIAGSVSISILDTTADHTWLEVGFGWLNHSGGYLAFCNYGGIHSVHLQYGQGRTDSGVVTLDNSGSYDFSVTAHADGSFSASVQDPSMATAAILTGVVSDTLATAPERVFAVGICDDEKGFIEGNITVDVPEPVSITLLSLSSLMLMRKRKAAK
jgi:hypothetical protein